MSNRNDESISFDTRNLKVKINEREVFLGDVSIDINFRINSHSNLRLAYFMQKSEDEFYQGLLSEEEVIVSIENVLVSGESKLLFKGFVEEIELEGISGNKYVRVEAVSKSQLLDRVKKFVSYQDVNITYQQIFDYIKGLYSAEEIGIVWESMSENLGELVIQYDETDWEFINRLLKKLDKGIEVKGTGIRLGFNSQKSITEIDMLRASVQGRRRFGKEYSEYLVSSEEIFLVGDGIKIKLGGNLEEFVIIEGSYSLDNRVLVGNYVVVREGQYKRKKVENSFIVGKAIEGTVVEVLDVEGIAKLTVNFNKNLVKRGGMIEDENGNEVETSEEEQLGTELFKFPYVTPYSQSHTGYFCTPEVGDNVVVYFPTEKEEDGFVLGSVNSIGNGRFTDRFNRNFIIPAEGSVNGEGIDEPQYNMTLGNNIFGVITGTTNKEVEFENINVLEDSTTVVTNNKSVRVDNDMMYQVANNKTVQVDNNLSFNVSNDYQAQSTNFKVQASANVDAQGSSGVNIKGAQVKVEADAEASIKGGAMVKVGAPSVSVGS